ncbi:MAG: hypothetical protein Q9211_004732 [Gyalolechia sp. 1 TL-2023]
MKAMVLMGPLAYTRWVLSTEASFYLSSSTAQEYDVRAPDARGDEAWLSGLRRKNIEEERGRI